jgi:hypothetical protein
METIGDMTKKNHPERFEEPSINKMIIKYDVSESEE